MISKSFKHGTSIIEAVLALAIFALVASSLASLGLGGGSGAIQSADNLEADLLATEGLEAVQAIKNRGWNELNFAPTSELINNRFTRTINFTPTTPADLRRREVNVKVSWSPRLGVISEARRQTLLTNWDSKRWRQTDWSLGAGQTNWLSPARFESGNLDFSTVGEIKLPSVPTNWSQYAPSPPAANLFDVHCLSASQCWAVGAASTGGEVILRWDGNVWTRLAPQPTIPDLSINSVFCVSASDCWAVGDQSNGETILRWQGGPAWTRLTLSALIPNVNLNSVFCAASNNCWAVGNQSNGETILRWQGGPNWVRQTPIRAIPNTNLNDIFCFASNNCWAVGNNSGGETILRWQGGPAWTRQTPIRAIPNTNLNDIFCFASNNCWAVGNNSGGETILRWQGGPAWTRQPFISSIPNVNLNSVSCLSANNCWIVGVNSAGEVLLRWQGGPDWLRVGPVAGLADVNMNALFTSTWGGFAVGATANIFQLTTGGYAPSGNLISSIFDMVGASPVEIIEWDETVPVCVPATACAVRLQLRVAPTAGGIPGAVWQGPTGAGSYFTLASGTLIPKILNGNRFVQYQVFLTGDGASTPVLSEVRLDYK